MFERKALPELLGQEAKFPNGLNGTFKLALNVGEPANVDITFEAMVAKGANVIYTPRNELWNMRSAVITGLDNNMIEIASDFWE